MAAGGADASLACRVVADTDGLSAHPVCETDAGTASAGQPCKGSSDCAPGLDCVAIGNTAQCAAYCCMGNSACQKTEFCDVAPLATATATIVPVCVPTVHCELLAPLSNGTCPMGETCSVVREDVNGVGTTSCVEVGDAKAGESCDSKHCGAGLACMGFPGNRQCYTLCHTATGDHCSATQSCKGGLPFTAAFGICVSP